MGALAHWAKIGKDMGVDLLIVRKSSTGVNGPGSSAGVTDVRRREYGLLSD